MTMIKCHSQISGLVLRGDLCCAVLWRAQRHVMIRLTHRLSRATDERWRSTAHSLDASPLDGRMEIINESFSPPWGSPSAHTALNLAHTAGIKLAFLSSLSSPYMPLLFVASSLRCLFSPVFLLFALSSLSDHFFSYIHLTTNKPCARNSAAEGRPRQLSRRVGLRSVAVIHMAAGPQVQFPSATSSRSATPGALAGPATNAPSELEAG